MTKSKKKDAIAEVALKLFNERGYDNVSLREIADEADTTIGNLTYHFPQKEDLIFSIQNRFQTDYLDDVPMELENGHDTLETIVMLFKKGQKNLDSNTFYFSNLVELSKNHKVIMDASHEFRLKLFHLYQTLLKKLVEYGMMRSEIREEQYEILSITLVTLSSFWIQNTSPYYDADLPSFNLFTANINMIYPYLTEMGIEILKTYLDKIN